jgi:hypothetical protein
MQMVHVSIIYMSEWDPPLSYVTCYKFHVELEAVVVNCYCHHNLQIQPCFFISFLEDNREQCQESKALQIILKNLFVIPLFKLIPRQAQILFSFIYSYI